MPDLQGGVLDRGSFLSQVFAVQQAGTDCEVLVSRPTVAQAIRHALCTVIGTAWYYTRTTLRLH
jgi:hypothetical protein